MKAFWLDTSEYPFTSHYYLVNGYRLHYIDEGGGEPLLFIHGTPSWSFEYRNLIKDLKKTNRCIAIDHIGFGLSEKPRQYDYSTQNHSHTLEKFIIDKNLTGVTLVVHDFGGPIGLNVAMNYPERVKKLVILNSWLWSSKNDPEFIKISKFLKSPLLPFLYRYINVSPRFILPGSFGGKKLSRHIHRHYIKPFGSISERNGPIAFARSLLNDQDWFEELWDRKRVIEDKPVLFIWGMKDPVLKPDKLKRFQSGFPNHQTAVMDNCGHFPQEENPVDVAFAIRKFLAE